jgi:hypothetical protein
VRADSGTTTFGSDPSAACCLPSDFASGRGIVIGALGTAGCAELLTGMLDWLEALNAALGTRGESAFCAVGMLCALPS